MTDDTVMIGWTTTGTEAQANDLAAALVSEKLAACVQVDGPVRSHYTWQGRTACESEFRLAVKFPAANAGALKAWLEQNHPYDTPQWVAVTCTDAHPGYAQWVRDCAM